MNEGLLRQRRNLIAVCVLLWVMKYGGVTFTKFSFVGFDIAFKNPNALTTTIWIAFTYFFYRYYQYITSEEIRKLSQGYKESTNSKCKPKIEEIILKCDPSHVSGGYCSFSHLRSNKWTYEWQSSMTKEECEALGEPEPPAYSSKMVSRSVLITPWMLRKQIINAVVDSTLRHSVVTDYLLPFFLAIGVLYYCGSPDWARSFFNV